MLLLFELYRTDVPIVSYIIEVFFFIIVSHLSTKILDAMKVGVNFSCLRMSGLYSKLNLVISKDMSTRINLVIFLFQRVTIFA